MTNSTAEQKLRFFCSWSGGKDSCLSLYRMMNAGYTCSALLTMIDQTGKNSRSHGLFPETLSMQANAMALPLITAKASWGNYETRFKEQIDLFKKQNITHGVFGDIDLEPHREWVERVCQETGITPHLPLWKENRRHLVEEFIAIGFKALIVAINTKKMPDIFLGRVIDTELINELEACGVDACGENGEFHSFVFDGPLFTRRLSVSKGVVNAVESHIFLPIVVTPVSETRK